MPEVEVEINNVHFSTIDVNIVPDLYVTWIVDIWEGNEHDPATQIERYIGTWRAEDLETSEGEARDPEFLATSAGQYGSSWGISRHVKPAPLVWESLETVKEADRDSLDYKESVESYMKKDTYSYGETSKRKELYRRFMLAIEVLGRDPENVEAWEAVEQWRGYDAGRFEK